MTQVVIQPSYGNPAARRHWASTLDIEVPFARDPYQSTLSAAELTRLLALHPTGAARFWGAVATHDRRMQTLVEGDVVLFTGQKIVRAVGEVGYSFRSAPFADQMWTADTNHGSFRNVYSLRAFEPAAIPYEEIWELPGFNSGDNFMGQRFLNEEKGEANLARARHQHHDRDPGARRH